MLNVNWNGQQLNIKKLLIGAAIIYGGYSIGANYPQLNPMQLIPDAVECAE